MIKIPMRYSKPERVAPITERERERLLAELRVDLDARLKQMEHERVIRLLALFQEFKVREQAIFCGIESANWHSDGGETINIFAVKE